MKAAELERIRLHNVKLLSNSLKLQCFSRQYLARQRVKARIWEVAIEMHVRSSSSILVTKIVRGFLGRRRVAWLLHQKNIALLNSTALKIQCWLRSSLAFEKTQRIRSRYLALHLREIERGEELERLRASDAARQRDEDKKEVERLRLEQIKR